MLLEEHKKLNGLISKVGTTNLGKGGDKNNIMRNPNQFMGKLQSKLDPKMMAQLGGAGNLMNFQMNMMKEMSCKPDLQKMMGSMGGDLEGLAKKKVVKLKK
jgi:signal recognition particle subunit SRP54